MVGYDISILNMILYFTFINFLKRNFNLYLFKVLGQAMHSIWGLSSLIRDQTHAPCIESTES